MSNPALRHAAGALLVEWGIPDSAIQVEGGSINTYENALFSHRLLAAHAIRRIFLVTSAMHLPQSAHDLGLRLLRDFFGEEATIASNTTSGALPA